MFRVLEQITVISSTVKDPMFYLNQMNMPFRIMYLLLAGPPTTGNYDGGIREEIKVYYNESNTVFNNFSEAGSIYYRKINCAESLRVANSQIDSGDPAYYNLTIGNLVGDSSPEGDCISVVP